MYDYKALLFVNVNGVTVCIRHRCYAGIKRRCV